jgi:eukaryotic-like serine/threonine-protein kinase
MATVYLGHDRNADRDVAIKVLHPELAASVGSDRFDREIQVASQLKHPHILGLYDSGSADGLMYYVMPFVTGESLRDKLDREHQLPVDEAVRLTLEVADALGFAHAQGIVHRDIKPENILLSDGKALVADFGIARAVTDMGQQKLTATGMTVGTPVYMAPEQAAGERVGPTADLYSLGCMLYEMLAGEPPYTGKNPMAIMARHAMDTVPSVRIVRPSVAEHIEDAIFQVLGKSPADRPQTAATFAALLRGEGVGTLATGTMRRPTTSRGMTAQSPVAAPAPWFRRPVVLAGAAAALAVAGGGVWWATSGGGGSKKNSGPSPEQIAVLYFDDTSPDGKLAYLADGLTESVIRTLAGVQGLSVVSSGGVSPFRGSKVPADSIARALRAGTLVRGSIAADGDQLNIQVKLEDATGAEVGASSLRLPASDLVRIRDSVGQIVATNIRGVVGREITLRKQRATTGNDKAWGSFQQGEQRRRAAEGATASGDTAAAALAWKQADSLFAAAEQQDKSWPAPAVARGFAAYRRARVPGLDPIQIRPLVDTGLGHVNRALQRDSLNADAYELRGNLQYFSWLVKTESDPPKLAALLDGGRRDLERAKTLEPQQAGAWASLSHLYYQVSDARLADVARAASSAYSADAYLINADVILTRLFLATYDLEQWVDAERWCEEIRRRFPSNFNAARCSLILLTAPVRPVDVPMAWRLADSVVALSPKGRQPFLRLNADTYVAMVLARAKMTDSARHVMERSIGDPSVDKTRDLLQNVAYVQLLLGDRAASVQSLSAFFQVNPQRKAGFLKEPTWWYRPLIGTKEWEVLKQ